MKKLRRQHKKRRPMVGDTTNVPLLIGIGNLAINTVRFVWTAFHHGWW